MLIVERPQTDPYFNIAAEEYLLKSIADDCFMIWRNEPSIIVGKHQNTLSEINYPFVKKHNIPVVRRITGGGTVFQDLGNINFTFIAKGEKEKLVDYRKFTEPIIEILNRIGVPASFEGKNDIRAKGLKISGNAEHIYKNKVLHHGTLLFSSDLGFLNKALKADPGKFIDRAIKSVRSEVTNISGFLKEPLALSDFMGMVIQHVLSTNKDSQVYSLTTLDVAAIQQLVSEKYATWKWNFGYSPNYELENSVNIGKEIIKSRVSVKNGMITEFLISGPPDKQKLMNLVKMKILNQPHEEETLLKLFSSLNADSDINPNQLLNLFF